MKLKKVLAKLNLPFSNLDELILNGEVKVNNEVVTYQNHEIKYEDVITIKNISIVHKEIINLALYKPKGYLSARKDNNHKVALELLPENYKYYKWIIAGRLDLDSEGLLILTTSGKFSNEVANPRYGIKKTYEVTLDRDIENQLLERIKEPMLLRDGKGELYKSEIEAIEKVSENKVLITISMGKYHQVKRMFLQLGYIVINLKRVSIGNITLKKLKPGELYEFKKEDLIL